MKPEIKKLLILNAPYLLFVYLFDKVGQAVRLAPGADMSAKLLSIGDGFSAAFSNAFPSVHPADLLIGLAGAVIVRLAVIRLCTLGQSRRYKALHRPGFSKQCAAHADGTADNEQPPEAAEVRKE